MNNVTQFPRVGPLDMKGPERGGHSVIVDGRCVPNMHMRENGDEIDLILDGRLCFSFPKELAYQAASFAANAMAIGAGYAFLGSDNKDRPFAPKVMMIEMTGEGL